MKVGVLVVAYNAETTLVDVLDRIRPEMRRELAEVLVQDDHSTDDTFSVATQYLQRGTDLHLTVLRGIQDKYQTPSSATPRTWATAATRSPATPTRSTTDGTSWCCCTATASTPPR